MLVDFALRGLSIAYGSAMFGFMAFLAAYRDGAFTRNRRPSDEEKQELKLVYIAQKQYWDLSLEPIDGFQHEFFTLSSGFRLHYVISSTAQSLKGKDIVIFIHGFPDSYLLWRETLASRSFSTNDNILVAVDLPGYGGSDSLDQYTPDNALEAIAGFILGVREQYHAPGAKVILVTHDWGSIIGARLASEAPQLADRFIITSAIIPRHVQSNASAAIASSKQMVRTYTRSPLNFRLLRRAYATFSPILSQLGKSFYVFIFNLPYPFSTLFATFGNFWFLRLLHRVQAGLINPKGTPLKPFTRELKAKEAATWIACSAGPGLEQLQSKSLGNRYSDDVRKRCADLGMSQKIRIYQDNLAWGTWEKSLETIVALSEIGVSPTRSSSGAGLFEDGPPGALKAPATIIYGKHDVAFEPRLCLDGLADYLTKESHIVQVDTGGHWLPNEPNGQKLIEAVLRWTLESESGTEQRGLAQALEEYKWTRLLADKSTAGKRE